MKTIEYYTKNVYGKELIYLANSKDSQLWYYVSGRRTITVEDMKKLNELTGTVFERVFEPTKVEA